MLWDTAGQEEFDAITKAYYRGAQAAVLAFSTTDRVSFDAIRSWKKKVRHEFASFVIKIVSYRINSELTAKEWLNEMLFLFDHSLFRWRTSVERSLW